MGAESGPAERSAALDEQVNRLKERLDRSRTRGTYLRLMLRRLAHDSAGATAFRAAVETELATSEWPEDAVAYLREILAPVWNFAWLVPGRLAGCGRPDTRVGVDFLAQQGVRTLLSLAEPPPADWLAEAAIAGHRIEGLLDQAAPSPGQLQESLRVIDHSLAAGKPVAVHCSAGLGRTGAVLASYLVGHGATAADAIADVRRAYNPLAIENEAQEESVRRFSTRVR